MSVVILMLYSVFSLCLSRTYSGTLSERDKVKCPIHNILHVPVQPNFDIMQFSGVWYVQATTTFIFGDLTGESKFREIIQDENGEVKIIYAGYYSHVQKHCVMGKSPNTKEYGAPGRYKDDSHHFYITVYTDYHYAITYICFDNNANEKCEHKEIQIEIWSKTPEFITETVMQDLKSIAADKLCINASDFVIIGIGICDPSKMLSPSTDQQKSNYCASLPCQHSGICAEEDGKHQCMCPAEYSGVYCEILCPITAITNSMAHSGFDLERFVGLWYVHSSTTMMGNSTKQSLFRELMGDKKGHVTLRYGGYDLNSENCIQEYQSGLEQEGQPGYLKYGSELEAVVAYTDYQKSIVFWLHSPSSKNNQECLDLQTHVEIWSKIKDPIPSDVLWNLKRKAEQTLCVQMVDFKDQQLG